MAKQQTNTSKKTAKKKASSKQSNLSILSFIKDGRFKKIVGLAFLLGCLFLLVSFFSYFYTWQTDQDKVFNAPNLWHFLTNNEIRVSNNAGKLGAYIAHQLIYKGLGLASLLLIPLFGIWGLNLLLSHRIYSTLKTIFYTTVFSLLLSPILAYFFSKANFSYGGALGNTFIERLNLMAGELGTLFIIIGLLLMFVILFFNPIFRLPFWHQLFHNNTTPSDVSNDNLNTVPVPVQPEFTQEAPPFEASVFAEDEPTESMDEIFVIEDEGIEPIDDTTLETSNTDTFELEVVPTQVSKPMTKTDDLTLEVLKKEEDIAQIDDSNTVVAGNEPYDPALELRNYKFPTLDLLENRSVEDISIDKNELEQNKNQIINTLKSFGIAIAKISATVGPTVTLYEIVPAEGVRISKIRNLEDDIALSLSALGIRIIAPIPGKGTIGIEVPNLKKQIVSMRTLISSDKFIHNDFSLPIAIGKKIDNENYIVDLAKMPHLLMAGATGQGKSVGINTILVSLLYKKHPSQLKFVMVDPKKVELSIYRVIEKHFLAKLPNEEDAIITDTKKVINTLNALCIEMDNRYDLLKNAGVRNIKEYNAKFIQRKLNPNKGHKYLPFIVLVVDEFADLIMTAGKEVEMPIARIAQLARAVGIHLIIATQRPSVNVITGTIKANFPARIAFKVSAKVDSRTILDSGGADQLIGQGDMLISNGSEIVRLQCAFVDTPEVERIVEFIGNQQGYPSAFELPEYDGADGGDLAGGNSKSLTNVDDMFEQCARLVVSSGSGSTSMLQRRFNLGYNRAGRIMDQLEAAGVVGASTGGKPRELMVHTENELDEILRAVLKY
ncbi:MAG: DNA translocase FtsK 4TM domain-containing protein [Bacteroidetes bacterium]|nr:DNA translocase FtsK 4TM domain-containing protein [Bacteroidota bacterium]